MPEKISHFYLQEIIEALSLSSQKKRKTLECEGYGGHPPTLKQWWTNKVL